MFRKTWFLVALTLLSSVAVHSQAGTPPLGHVDVVGDSVSHSLTVNKSNSVFVQGWAADVVDGSPVKQVQILIDGTAVGNATLGAARPDVVAAYAKLAYLDSGWSFTYPASGLATGSHTVSAVATNNLNLSTTLGTATITVSTVGTAPLGYIDVAGDSVNLSQTVSTSNSLVVRGWAADVVDGAPVAQLRILIDGTQVGAVTTGLARPDVAAAYSNLGWTRSGWSFTYPATNLSVGIHTVSAVASDVLLLSSTLGTKTITVASTSQSAPFGFVDSAGDSVTGSSTISNSGSVLVQGWAADAQQGSPVSSVQVLIDGTTAGTATLGLSRPDVAASYGKPAYGLSGWSFTLPASGLAPGSHVATALATDSLGLKTTLTNSSTFSVTGLQLTGTVIVTNGCNAAGSQPPITLTLNTTPPMVTTTNSFGSYTFTNVPAGTWTITPSITGPSSVFSPAAKSVTVTNAPLASVNIYAQLGYSVSGTVSYAGAKTGRVYVSLVSTICGSGIGETGTSIASPGAFTINGVAPGTYTLTSRMDTQGFGAPNLADPLGQTTGVSLTNANLTGQSVTMNDPAAYSVTAGPTLKQISPTAGGVVIGFSPLTGADALGNTSEVPTTYTVQWSTDSTFATGVTSHSFPAGAGGGTGVWILNTGLTGLSTAFVDGTTYYFRAQGVAPSGAGPFTVFGGTTPTGVAVGAPTAGNTVTGAVTFTAAPTGPLYVGFYDVSNGKIYATRIASPVSPQNYTVQVPTGNTFFFFAILDQNNNGVVDPGDVSNTNDGSPILNAIPPTTPTEDLTLASLDTQTRVSTLAVQQTLPTGTNSFYGLNFNIRERDKLPVAVQITSGPHVIHPVDLAPCTNCGSHQFQYQVQLGSTAPTVGDAYNVNVTFNDGTSTTLTPTVTAVVSGFVTSLAPQGAVPGDTNPTFTWTYPANPTGYIYGFSMNGPLGTIWQVPSQNSNLNGFTSSVPQIVFGTDPTGDGTNLPTVPSLTTGTTYYWYLSTIDPNANIAIREVYFIP